MNEYAQLLATIKEHPEDDAPRWIAADWLEENGHPERGQFIRAHLKYERSLWCAPECSFNVGCRHKNPECRSEHWQRCHQLLFQGDWWGQRPTYGAKMQYFGVLARDERDTGLCWERGWIKTSTGSFENYLRHGPELCRDHPMEIFRVEDRSLHIDHFTFAGSSRNRFTLSLQFPGPESLRERYEDFKGKLLLGPVFDTMAGIQAWLGSNLLRWAQDYAASHLGEPHV